MSFVVRDIAVTMTVCSPAQTKAALNPVFPGCRLLWRAGILQSLWVKVLMRKLVPISSSLADCLDNGGLCSSAWGRGRTRMANRRGFLLVLPLSLRSSALTGGLWGG